MNSPQVGFDLQNILKNKLGKDLLAYLPAKAGPAIIAFISIPVYTRLFAPDEYGLYTLLIATVSLLVLILFSGLAHAGLRYFAEYVKQEEQVAFLSTIFITWFAILFVSYGLFGAVYIYLERYTDHLEQPRLVLLTVLLLASQSLYQIVLDLLRANRKSVVFAVFSLVFPLGRLAGAVILVSSRGMGVEALILSSFLFELLLGLAGVIILKVKISFTAYSVKLLKRMLGYGMPLIGTAVLAWLLSLADRYIIGYYHGTDSVGIYSMAYNLGASSLQTVFMVLMLAAFPIIIQTWNDHGQKNTEILVSRLTGYYCGLTIPIVAGITVLGRPLLEVLATPQYVEGFTVLPWVAAGLFFLGYSQYVNKVWELNEKTMMILILHGLTVVINVGLNFLLVPAYGFPAAGATTAFSYAFYLACSWALSSRYFSIKVNLPAMLKMAASAAIMVAVILLFRQYFTASPSMLLAAIFSGAAVYLLGIYLSGVFRKELSIIFDRSDQKYTKV